MSYWVVGKQIHDLLGDRLLLTFSVGTKPVSYLCYSGYSGTPTFVVGDINTLYSTTGPLLVYNPTTQTIETLDSSFKKYLTLKSALGLTALVSVNVESTEYPLPLSLTKTSGGFQITFMQSGTNFALTYQETVNGISTLLFFNKNYVPPGPVDNQVAISVVNALSISDITTSLNTVSFAPTDKCCYQDVPNLIVFALLLTVLLSKTNTYAYTSLTSCQQADEKCICPANKLCWMYNNTNVPCCVQGNPLDPRFSNDAPALITQDKNECVSNAVKCSQWRFNTVDVPCCIQRTPEQWTYDTSTMQSFDQYSDCLSASRDTCTFNAFLNQPPNPKDYYNLILESNFTSGCEPLRTVNPFGTSADCSKDPDPVACQYGNCTQNYCKLWSSSGTNPYMFTQNVRCLPPVQCCSGTSKQFICNAGKSNAYACCSSSGQNTCCQ